MVIKWVILTGVFLLVHAGVWAVEDHRSLDFDGAASVAPMPSPTGNYDLGIVEFLSPLDSCVDSSSVVSVVLRNYGAYTIDFSADSCVVNLISSGVQTQQYSLSLKSDSLQSGDTVHLTLATSYPKWGVGLHQFTAYLSLQSDTNSSNDSAVLGLNIDSTTKANSLIQNSNCRNSKPLFLAANGSPAGGMSSYSGKGIIGNLFYPDSAGQGPHSIQHVYTDQHGCTDTIIDTLFVDSVPSVTYSGPANICMNSMPVRLSGGQPTGGIYFGQNVSLGFFVPRALGSDTIAYTWTDVNSCSDTVYSPVRVDSVPLVNLTGGSSLCLNEDTLSPTGGSPLGGVYYGPLIKGGVIQPRFAGTDTLYYTFTDANGCRDSVDALIHIDTIPVVKLHLPNTEFCSNETSFPLSGGSPLNGVYSGSGIQGGDYIPGLVVLGRDTVAYSFTDFNGCSSSDTNWVTVHQAPKVTFDTTLYACSRDDAFPMTGGYPLGGVYSGPGVDSLTELFEPSSVLPGSVQVTYQFFDSNSCEGSDTGVVEVEETPVFSFGADTGICGSEQVVLDVGINGLVYRWSTGDSTRQISVQSSSVIWSLVIDPGTTNGCSWSDTVRIDYDQVCVGIEESQGPNFISIYPNPTHGLLNLEIQDHYDEASLEILNAQGQQVLSDRTIVLGVISTLDLSELPNGLYVVQLRLDKEIARRVIFKL